MIRHVLLGALVLLATSGCGALTGRPLETWAQDKGVTTRVKARLAAVEPVTLTRVHVDTYEGIVYLTGGVSTLGTKRNAETIAREVPGVEQVVNNLHLMGEGVLAMADTDVAASPATDGATRPTTRRESAHPLMQRYTWLRIDLDTGTPGWTRYSAYDAGGRRVATVYSLPAGELARNGAAPELTGAEGINHVSLYRQALQGAVQYDLVLWHISREEIGRLK